MTNIVEEILDYVNDAISGITNSITDGIKEALAIVSNIAALASAIWAIVGLLQLISENGLISGFMIYLALGIATSLIAGIFAEILGSTIPTPLKWIIELVKDFLEIIGIM
jgi:hypothetical protein